MDMSNKYFKITLFLFASMVVISFVAVLTVQYGVGMHGGCPKCRDADKDLGQLSNKLYLLQISKNYSDSFGALNEGLEGSKILMVDPWGNEYLYSSFLKNNYQCFVVWSFGSDGTPGGNKEHELDIFKFGQCKEMKTEQSGTGI